MTHIFSALLVGVIYIIIKDKIEKEHTHGMWEGGIAAFLGCGITEIIMKNF